MKYNRKIVEKALTCCGIDNDCRGCPLKDECGSNPFESTIAKYSAKYVEDLKEEIASLKTVPEQLHREMSEQMLEERRIERKYTAKKMRALVHRELERMCLAEDAYIPFPLTWLDRIMESIIDEKNT